MQSPLPPWIWPSLVFLARSGAHTLLALAWPSRLCKPWDTDLVWSSMALPHSYVSVKYSQLSLLSHCQWIVIHIAWSVCWLLLCFCCAFGILFRDWLRSLPSSLSYSVSSAWIPCGSCFVNPQECAAYTHIYKYWISGFFLNFLSSQNFQNVRNFWKFMSVRNFSIF